MTRCLSGRTQFSIDPEPLRILAFSNLYPDPEHPHHGVFLQHRLKYLQRLCILRVLRPVPWFPFRSGWFGSYAGLARIPDYDMSAGLLVRYGRYFLIPKIGMWLTPFAMALSTVWEIKRLRRSGFHPDIIDAYYLYPDGVAATLAGKWLGIPVVLTALGSDVSEIAQLGVPRKMIKWALRQAKATTAVCRAIVNSLGVMGADRGKLHVVEHGVDTELFTMPVDRERSRQELGFSRFTILSVGNLISLKGHDLAIRAIALVPDVELQIIGTGPDWSALEKLVKKLDVGDRVVFRGALPQAQLARMMGAADLLINCSEREGIANVLIEALACGTPVAATAVWGSPEVVTSEHIGILFRSRDHGAIAEGIKAAINRTWDRDEICRHAARYSWLDTAAKHFEILAIAARSSH